MKRRYTIIITAIILALLIWHFYNKTYSGENISTGRFQRPSTAVEAAKIEIRPISDIKNYTGTLHPRSQFVVAPKVQGRLDKLFVNIGDTVKAGQLIAILESQEYIQAVEQARAELNVAEANHAESRVSLELSKKEYERILALSNKNFVSQSELEEAYSRYMAHYARHKVTKAQVEQREAALRAAEVRLSYTEIRAFWEGDTAFRTVGKRFVDEGAMLRANDSIVTIIDIDTLTALIDITERDYSYINTGQSVNILTESYPGKVFNGIVTRKSPVLRESTRTASVEIEIQNKEHQLKPGMFVRAGIQIAHYENAVVIPHISLLSRDGTNGVYHIESLEKGDDAKARFVALNIGVTANGFVQILSSKLSGYVITLGHHLISDGSSVIVSNADELGYSSSHHISEQIDL